MSVAKPDRSPWLSVWSSPGDTIERVLAAKSWPYSLAPWLLAAGATAAHEIAVMARTTGTVPLLDWFFLLNRAFDWFVFGAANLSLCALILRWSGGMLGGRASFDQLRAAFAWGMAPVCAALVIDVVIILGAGGPTGKIPADAIMAMKGVGFYVNVWTAIATITMLKRVQAFDWWRAIVSYAAGVACALSFWALIRYLLSLMPGLQSQLG